ncbi:MAG: response regulator, partial [Phreatobacter sp.]|uniref:response regulator n=1 Tax=Phreatobacter sp. TaxID=1966341 RepID=UPI004036FA27
MVGDYLKLHGFRVSLCDGGAALRRALEEERPALVVLDLNMPGEDGLSIVRDLKQRLPLPVIMLTATASPDDRVNGLDLGADDYLAKPCELRELLARIRALLRRAVFDEVGGYDPVLVQLQDFDFWVRLCARHEIRVGEHPATGYRVLGPGRNASWPTPETRRRSA